MEGGPYTCIVRGAMNQCCILDDAVTVRNLAGDSVHSTEDQSCVKKDLFKQKSVKSRSVKIEHHLSRSTQKIKIIYRIILQYVSRSVAQQEKSEYANAILVLYISASESFQKKPSPLRSASIQPRTDRLKKIGASPKLPSVI